MAGLRTMLRSLSHRNFRLFFLGQGISLIGTWMQSLAMAWLVYNLTDFSKSWLGIVNFCGQIPTFFMAPLAGVLADRWNRHRVIVVTQTLSMLQAFALAYLSWAGLIQVWHIVALSIFLGTVFAFDMTARQSFLAEMVEGPEDLGNAIALNSSMVNGARLVGPALAGLLLKASNESVCFFLNGVSFLAVIIALLMMHVPPVVRPKTHPPLIKGFVEGYRYAFGFPPIRSVLLLLALVSAVGLPYTVLLPVFAKEILHGGPDTLGYLMAASGIGALTGAVYLASRKSVLGLGRLIAIGPAAFGGALIGFSFSTNLWLSLPLLFVIGFAMMVQMASTLTILQTITPEEKRGRVTSFYAMAFMGMSPVGSLLAGNLADVIGAPRTLLFGGAACILGSVIFLRHLPTLRHLIRPIYRQLGILPEVAQGLQTASEISVPPEKS
jgi:MFS family permease